MNLREIVTRGTVIPAHPLALNARRQFDERRHRALTRYYIDAGAGGIAVGVHTTQFAIRRPGIDLLDPVLALTSEAIDEWAGRRGRKIFKVAGLCGDLPQAMREAALAHQRGYHAGLLSLAGRAAADLDALIVHCCEVASVIPVIGFYLQPAVGGCVLPYAFWRRFAEIENVIAIKIAPFNRYLTLDVVRAVAEAGRADSIALYTGNDDHIVLDLLTPHRFASDSALAPVRIVGGLLGHWAVWTQPAVELLDNIRRVVESNAPIPASMLLLANQITDANAALFDAGNAFRGCIAGIHEVLRRQGLLEGTWCLDPQEGLSPGQSAEIDRVYRAYPHLTDDHFVRENLDKWLG